MEVGSTIVFVLERVLKPFPFWIMENDILIAILEGNFKTEAQKVKQESILEFFKRLGVNPIIKEKLN